MPAQKTAPYMRVPLPSIPKGVAASMLAAMRGEHNRRRVPKVLRGRWWLAFAAGQIRKNGRLTHARRRQPTKATNPIPNKAQLAGSGTATAGWKSKPKRYRRLASLSSTKPDVAIVNEIASAL